MREAWFFCKVFGTITKKYPLEDIKVDDVIVKLLSFWIDEPYVGDEAFNNGAVANGITRCSMVAT